ncbi:MAG: hypothetical protein GWP91_02895 [Rhodobacterales bacterium]|nr:hypothetical protein [Rhodobacterales bacterium]
MEKQKFGFVLVLVFGLSAASVWFLQPNGAPSAPQAQLGNPVAQPNAPQTPIPAAGADRDRSEVKQRRARAQAAGQEPTPPGPKVRGNNTTMLREATLRTTKQFAKDQGLSEDVAASLVQEITQLLDDTQVLYEAAQANPQNKRGATRKEMRALLRETEERLVELFGIDLTAEFLSKLQRR